MRYSKNQILLIVTNLLIIAILFSVGNSSPYGQVSLAVLFTVLLWKKTDQQVSRWLALCVLWGGILLAAIWPGFF
ncbi:MAG: hypothetical protein ACE5I1_13200 [bacterium]